MFKSSSRNKANKTADTSLEVQRDLSCLIAKGTTIDGKVNSSDSIRIDGTIRGEINCDKRLIVGASGHLEGTIHATDATIRGYVKGNLTVKGILRLESTARIEGYIIAKAMEVEEGAQYEGECKVGERFAEPSVTEVEMALVA